MSLSAAVASSADEGLAVVAAEVAVVVPLDCDWRAFAASIAARTSMVVMSEDSRVGGVVAVAVVSVGAVGVAAFAGKAVAAVPAWPVTKP